MNQKSNNSTLKRQVQSSRTFQRDLQTGSPQNMNLNMNNNNNLNFMNGLSNYPQSTQNILNQQFGETNQKYQQAFNFGENGQLTSSKGGIKLPMLSPRNQDLLNQQNQNNDKEARWLATKSSNSKKRGLMVGTGKNFPSDFFEGQKVQKTDMRIGSPGDGSQNQLDEIERIDLNQDSQQQQLMKQQSVVEIGSTPSNQLFNRSIKLINNPMRETKTAGFYQDQRKTSIRANMIGNPGTTFGKNSQFFNDRPGSGDDNKLINGKKLNSGGKYMPNSNQKQKQYTEISQMGKELLSPKQSLLQKSTSNDRIGLMSPKYVFNKQLIPIRTNQNSQKQQNNVEINKQNSNGTQQHNSNSIANQINLGMTLGAQKESILKQNLSPQNNVDGRNLNSPPNSEQLKDKINHQILIKQQIDEITSNNNQQSRKFPLDFFNQQSKRQDGYNLPKPQSPPTGSKPNSPNNNRPYMNHRKNVNFTSQQSLSKGDTNSQVVNNQSGVMQNFSKCSQGTSNTNNSIAIDKDFTPTKQTKLKSNIPSGMSGSREHQLQNKQFIFDGVGQTNDLTKTSNFPQNILQSPQLKQQNSSKSSNFNGNTNLALQNGLAHINVNGQKIQQQQQSNDNTLESVRLKGKLSSNINNKEKQQCSSNMYGISNSNKLNTQNQLANFQDRKNILSGYGGGGSNQGSTMVSSSERAASHEFSFSNNLPGRQGSDLEGY